MAPNRKQIAIVLDPLVDTLPLVQAKYLPLTAETEAAPASSSSPEPSSTIILSNDVDEDYWAWESPAAPADLFSADHFEANLAEEAARLATTNTPIVVASHDDEEADNYWAERVEARYSQENAAISNRTGYWEWPQEDIEATALHIALILKEEFARQQVSAETIEQRLLQDAANCQHRLDQTQAENDDYWAWESPTTVHAEPSDICDSYWEWDAAVESEDAQKERLMATIVAYEQARQLLSAQHLEEQLLEQSAMKECEPATLKSSSDAYWNYPAQEDDYWNMRPLPACVVAEAPMKGYWDW